MDPFYDSQSLASWAADALAKQGIDELARWRMLEYWAQVELFRALERGQADGWRHLGDFEQPYFTHAPLSGSKTNYKWADLVCAKQGTPALERIAWVELKDLGRNPQTLANNARGVGQDLAALFEIDPEQTRLAWEHPPDDVVDQGRTSQWAEFAPGLSSASHIVAQVVLIDKEPLRLLGDEALLGAWSDSFRARVGAGFPKIARWDTDRFVIFATVLEPKRSRSCEPPNKPHAAGGG